MTDRSVQARDLINSVVVTGDGNAVTLTFGSFDHLIAAVGQHRASRRASWISSFPKPAGLR